MGQCVLKSSLVGSQPVPSAGSTTYIKANLQPPSAQIQRLPPSLGQIAPSSSGISSVQPSLPPSHSPSIKFAPVQSQLAPSIINTSKFAPVQSQVAPSIMNTSKFAPVQSYISPTTRMSPIVQSYISPTTRMSPTVYNKYVQYGPSDSRYPTAPGIKSFNANNIIDCNNACDSDPKCVGYVFNKAPGATMGQCVLKSSLVGSQPVPSAGSTTYIKANLQPPSAQIQRAPPSVVQYTPAQIQRSPPSVVQYTPVQYRAPPSVVQYTPVQYRAPPSVVQYTPVQYRAPPSVVQQK